jgi:UPF0716 family protein affecting phage T7 exclusion
MYKFFIFLLFLPLLEVIGFFAVVARIGFLPSMLWLFCSTVLGMYLLRTGGLTALRRAREKSDDVFQLEDAFDSLCTLIAALLLIFPGFISDFIAVPFLLAPFRHWLFGRAKSDPDSFMRTEYQRWTQREPRGAGAATPTVIEGEFKRMDDPPQLPGQ